MTLPIDQLKARLATLRKDPRVVAFRLHPLVGQGLCVLDDLVAELERQAEGLRRQGAAIAALETQLAGLGALRVNPMPTRGV